MYSKLFGRKSTYARLYNKSTNMNARLIRLFMFPNVHLHSFMFIHLHPFKIFHLCSSVSVWSISFIYIFCLIFRLFTLDYGYDSLSNKKNVKSVKTYPLTTGMTVSPTRRTSSLSNGFDSGVGGPPKV